MRSKKTSSIESEGQSSRVSRVTTRSLVVASIILGAGLGAGIEEATAASSTSAWAYYTVNGVSYRNNETIWAYSPGASVQTEAYAETTNGSSVPAGWIGASTDIDRSDGALCTSSGWSYNNVAEYNWDNIVQNYCGAHYYYGIGATKGYNGGGYTGYYTNQTVNLYAS
jgi:hypothetical protein